MVVGGSLIRSIVVGSVTAGDRSREGDDASQESNEWSEEVELPVCPTP